MITDHILLLAALGAASTSLLAGCGSYEQRCDLNPYACAEGGAGTGTASGITCGPCEEAGESGECEPVRLVSQGACADKETCSADLECRKDVGYPCGNGSVCATGVCGGEDGKTCATCTSDADCADHPDSHLCGGGWCRRAAGAACKTDAACITNLCGDGVCAACASGAECASGQCDDVTARCLSSAGEPCTSEADCASGQCDGSLCLP
jgi:hypothetical protein